MSIPHLPFSPETTWLGFCLYFASETFSARSPVIHIASSSQLLFLVIIYISAIFHILLWNTIIWLWSTTLMIFSLIFMTFTCWNIQYSVFDSFLCLRPMLRCSHSFPGLYIQYICWSPLRSISCSHLFFDSRLISCYPLCTSAWYVNLPVFKWSFCFPDLYKPASPFARLSKRHPVVQAKIQESSGSFSFPTPRSCPPTGPVNSVFKIHRINHLLKTHYFTHVQAIFHLYYSNDLQIGILVLSRIPR